ncbi:MAG: hypothetical protein WA063_05775 [Minisyncoccia bacterium]
MRSENFDDPAMDVTEDNAKEIIDYADARKAMRELLDRKAGNAEELEKTRKDIENIDPFRLKRTIEERGGLIDNELIERIVNTIKQSKDPVPVDILADKLKEKEIEKKTNEIKGNILKVEEEIIRITDKLENFKDMELDERAKAVLENDRMEMERLKSEKKKLKKDLEAISRT